MKKLVLALVILITGNVGAQEVSLEQKQGVDPNRVAEYIHWYPAIKQVEMRDQWLENYQPGEWQFSGSLTANDRTVITPQAGVNYGYSWFNISDEPVVVTMPVYDKYYSLSVFDMNHFMQVIVSPDKPVVIRLPHQKSPIEDAYEIVLATNQGLVFSRQVIVNNEKEVMALAHQMTITGGGGSHPFIVPDFTEEEAKAGMEKIKSYSMKVKEASKIFGSTYEGVGDMDRAAGVFLGQLGTQAYVVQYAQYVKDADNDGLGGEHAYEIVVPEEGIVKGDNGYWTITVYNLEDRYLIPNKGNIYYISSYNAVKNEDGTVTVRINKDGKGENAIPTEGKMIYIVFRAYEPVNDLSFPEIMKVE